MSIAILATLAGADSFVAIERYGIAKQSWLETFSGVTLWDSLPRYLWAGDGDAVTGGVGEAVSGLGQWHQ